MSGAADAAHTEVERDTDAPASVNLHELLLPQRALPSAHRRFAVAYNAGLLEGWAKQSSPACAAASIAGAYNALAGLSRDDEGALTQPDLVAVLETILEDKLRMADTRLASALVAPIAPLIRGIEEELAAQGDTLDQKWPKGGMRKAVMAAVRKRAEAHAAGEALVFERLQAYYTEMAAAAEANDNDDGGGDDDDDDDDAAEADDAGGNETVVEFFGRDQANALINPGWKKYLMLYLKTYAGLLKLRRPNPSTGFFGNWGILAAAKRLSEAKEPGLQPRLLMGKTVRGSKVDVKLSVKDKPADVDRQWEALRTAFMREDTVIIYHLKNHYALLYALREWVTSEGEAVRQILTARKGQRPSVWIDFTEARETMIKWAGYKMIALQRR